ncbi:MAG TPA: hypothetical protein VF123_09560 [Candidatus Sulfotelmatobacter sp.]
MDGPNLFRELIKRGEVIDSTRTTASPATARAVMKDWHPNVPLAKATDAYATGHDTPTRVDALGCMSGDTSQQDQDDSKMDEVLLDATLFDEKVRQLVQGAAVYRDGYQQSARAQGLIKRVNPEVVAAVKRLQQAAPLLNRAVALTKARLAEQGRSGSASASASGSASGSQAGSYTRHARGETSTDGSASGSASGEVSKSVVIKALAGQIADRLRLMGRGGEA